MPFCGNCGHPLSDTDLTCPNCGEIRPNAIPKPDSINQEPVSYTHLRAQHQTPQQNQISIRNRAIPTLPLNRQILRFRIIMTMSLLIRTTLKQILPLRTIFREKFRSRTLPPHRIQRRKPTLHRIFLLMASATTTSRTETLLISSNQIFRDNLISRQTQIHPLTPTMIPTRPRIHH